MKDYRVAVLRGGPSEEYDVSMKTGASVLEALSATPVNNIDVVITREGEWLVEGRMRPPADILHSVDTVFLALHGTYGEDGGVQRLLDRFGVPYTGSRAYPSSVAMNKVFTKNLLKDSGIKMAPHIYLERCDTSDYQATAVEIESQLGSSYVIKPVSGGSSVGTMLVNGTDALANALKDALSVYDAIMVEKVIMGSEATVGVIEHMRDHSLYTLPPVEIIPKTEFFDYEAKYNGETDEICPGRFNAQHKTELERLAAQIHKELNLSHYSRSDFIVAKDGVYFLEVNTLPGLTTESLLPKSLEAVGIPYTDFLLHLLRLSLNRHNDALKS